MMKFKNIWDFIRKIVRSNERWNGKIICIRYYDDYFKSPDKTMKYYISNHLFENRRAKYHEILWPDKIVNNQ